MNWQKTKKYIRIVGSVIGFGIFIYLVINAVKELTTISELIVFREVYSVFALLVGLFIYFLQMINFQMILLSLRADANFKYTMIGYAYSFLHKYIPGYIWGYVSRSEWFEREALIPAKSSWIASGVEIVITVATSLAIWLNYYLLIRGVDGVWAFIVILIPFVIIIPINLTIPYLRKREKIDRFLDDFDSIPLSKWSLITVNSYFQWGLFGVGLWATWQAFSLQINLTSQNLVSYIYLFARAWVSGFLMIIIPNGIGIREVVLKELLVEVIHIDSTMAVLISTSYRLVLMATELIWVVLMVLVNRRLFKKK